MKFSELPLHQQLLAGLDAARFVSCMPVQEKTLPTALEGRDLMVQSKTGSGKTAVFLVVILQKFINVRERVKHLSAEEAYQIKLPVALVIAPTRELAVQIEEDAKLLAGQIPDFRIGCFYGGVGYGKQDEAIAKGLDLIIATPGRLLDYQQMGKLDLRKIDTFVIDEADRMFDMGFYPDIQRMFTLMAKREERQTMLFSATLSTKVRNLAWQYMNNPVEFEVQPEEITVKQITQELYHVAKEDKFSLFLRLIHHLNPTNALIFTNTKHRAVEVSKRLQANGFQTQYLMGDLPQSKRLAIINRMKRGALRFLVATDVAARGLQIDDLALVVNYDIPEDFESYVHRIGRTARAGKSGKAISLACDQYVYSLEAIEDFIQMKIPVMWPTEEELPLVVDKSASLRIKSQNERKRSAPAPSRAPRPRNKPKESTKYSRPQPRSSSKGKNHYNEIGKMDFDERMAYYKNAFGGDLAPQKKEGKSERVQVEVQVAKKRKRPLLSGVFKNKK